MCENGSKFQNLDSSFLKKDREPENAQEFVVEGVKLTSTDDRQALIDKLMNLCPATKKMGLNT